MKAALILALCAQVAFLVFAQDTTTTTETTTNTETTTTGPTTTTADPTTTTTGAATTTTGAATTTTGAATTTTGTATTTTGKTTTTKTTTSKKTTTTTTKKPKTSPPPKCSERSFNAELFKKCCVTAPRPIIAENKNYSKICKDGLTNGGLKRFNDFKLNKLQSLKSNLNNSVNFNSADFIIKLYKDAVYVNCVLQTFGAYDNVTGTINVTALQILLSKNQNNTRWQQVISEAAEECVAFVTDLGPPMMKEKNTTTAASVKSDGYLVSQCVLFKVIDGCEVRVNKTDCNTGYGYFDECKAYLFPKSAGRRVIRRG